MMNYKRLRIFIPLLIGLLSPFGARAAAWSEGDPLPDLSTYALTGDLPDLAGKVVLVDFWASWCAPCKASFPALSELQVTYADQGLVVLAVNVDTDLKAYERFVERMKPEFAIVRDSAQKLVAAAGVATMPSSFLIGRDGIIREVHAGYHGDRTHDEYVAGIEALLSQKPGASE